MTVTVIGYTENCPGLGVPDSYDPTVVSSLTQFVKVVRDRMEEGYHVIGVVGHGAKVLGYWQRDADVEGWGDTYEMVKPSSKFSFRFYARIFSHREEYKWDQHAPSTATMAV